ncbi:MAG: HEAT repeat domain-containing protein [Planctomycetes bacterium]|nr:HEAT repeat domain-containing protein [Planctomycetota bacterium]
MIERTIFTTCTLSLLLFLGGCVTDDFNDLAKGFAPVTPNQAAMMASDQHSPDERREGITLLANSPFGGGPPYVSMYRDYVIEDGDPLVRAAAIKALARYAEVTDAELIAPWLRSDGSESIQVRREAAVALQRIHNPIVVGDLLRSLGDENEDSTVRAFCATALGHYPEDRVLLGLISSLDANELTINLASSESLHILTGQVFGTDQYAWFEWYRATHDANNNPFEAMTFFQYPTFKYETRWYDRFVFWEHRNEEKPDVPVGLEDPTRRSTYDDSSVSQ